MEEKLFTATNILEMLSQKNVTAAEVYLTSSKTLKIDILNQQIESLDEIEEIGCAIRIIKDQKSGFAYTSDFTEEVLEETIAQVMENAQNSAPDPYLAFARPTVIAPLPFPIYDQKLPATPIAQKIALAKQIEAAAFSADPRIKKSEKTTYFDAQQTVQLVNSYGLNLHYETNQCGASTQVIAVDGNEMEEGYATCALKHLANINPDKMGWEAASKALEMLHARSIPSQKIPVILDPLIGAELLEVIAAPLAAEAVQKGKSLFADKIGQAIGASLLTIIDNGRLENGLNSAPFDDEGVQTQSTSLIQQGKLKNYLHNLYTAQKGGNKSTGNALRASYKTMPGIAATNLYIAAGTKSASDILRSVSKGLYITRLMGLHTANPISGEVSLGAAGMMVENGEKTYPVRGITLACNLVDLLKGITEIGNDLTFTANLGSPTILIADISVSGHA